MLDLVPFVDVSPSGVFPHGAPGELMVKLAVCWVLLSAVFVALFVHCFRAATRRVPHAARLPEVFYVRRAVLGGAAGGRERAR